MKFLMILGLVSVSSLWSTKVGCPFPNRVVSDSIPSFLKGNFIDDYGIKYTITDKLWTQHPSAKYHIIRWNAKEQYLIARNDDQNPSDPGAYSRIDYMRFDNMDPWKWGFCLSVYSAKSDSAAENGYKADRANPRKGCNGFPFSRMKSTN